ncbi:MAG: hypothetical protein WBI14_00575 [Anaerolineaceae bacterium]
MNKYLKTGSLLFCSIVLIFVGSRLANAQTYPTNEQQYFVAWVSDLFEPNPQTLINDLVDKNSRLEPEEWASVLIDEYNNSIQPLYLADGMRLPEKTSQALWYHTNADGLIDQTYELVKNKEAVVLLERVAHAGDVTTHPGGISVEFVPYPLNLTFGTRLSFEDAFASQAKVAIEVVKLDDQQVYKLTNQTSFEEPVSIGDQPIDWAEAIAYFRFDDGMLLKTQDWVGLEDGSELLLAEKTYTITLSDTPADNIKQSLEWEG